MMERVKPAAIFSVLVLISSCAKLPQAADETKAQNDSVNQQLFDGKEEKLAEMIMMAPSYSFNSERDPFRPITGRTWSGAESPSSDTAVVSGDDELRLLGIISFGGVTYAVIQAQGKTKPYKVNEMVGTYLLESIDSKRVILKGERDQLELKVGGS